MKKGLLTFLSLIVLVNLFSFVLTTSIAQADVGREITEQLEPIGDVYDQDNVDEGTFTEAIAKVIKIVLGFLGVIFIILILYAGFTWMTAAGNEEKVKKAKDIMVAAVIGVTIVLMAYAITYFVIDQLLEATDVGTGLN